jgi:hypothetical protein
MDQRRHAATCDNVVSAVRIDRAVHHTLCRERLEAAAHATVPQEPSQHQDQPFGSGFRPGERDGGQLGERAHGRSSTTVI